MVTIVALKFAMSSHFSFPKNPHSLFWLSQMVRRVIEDPRQMIDKWSNICLLGRSEIVLPIKNMNQINTKNYWKSLNNRHWDKIPKIPRMTQQTDLMVVVMTLPFSQVSLQPKNTWAYQILSKVVIIWLASHYLSLSRTPTTLNIPTSFALGNNISPSELLQLIWTSILPEWPRKRFLRDKKRVLC